MQNSVMVSALGLPRKLYKKTPKHYTVVFQDLGFRIERTFLK